MKISFSGVYPPGSSGNEHARTMCDFVARMMVQTRPSAVLLDLTELDYESGDAITGIIYALRTDSGNFLPYCIAAQNLTRNALESLLGNSLLKVTGGTLLESIDAGTADLLSRIRRNHS